LSGFADSHFCRFLLQVEREYKRKKREKKKERLAEYVDL